ncbi:MAG: transcription antitermination factor NusB [Candidatus Marinimicrobia bacterium]|nr:transcription antitermination factor NusB [Candidatus Neomarinimicrobiota bacterium]MCF7829910.1 transcription antitermination factor NusB [Candidatus Neomarinimicrobiota bacterium]MCF7879127.1 transcription antitermination factor NusB [Candidatus Neomarinimicrobiota bacterium]
MQGRRKARECVLKALYAQEYTDERMEQVVEDIAEREALPSEQLEFTKKLALKTHVNAEEFDEMIMAKSEHWEFGRIATLDRLVLRIAICELIHFDDIPPKVSVSEAIEIAKEYSTENSGSFVNGILDSIMNDLKNEGRIFLE